MKIIKYVLILFSVFSISCNNSTEPNYFNSQNFSIGIINFNKELVATEVNKLLADLNPKTTSYDPTGNRENISTLVNRINSKCENISAELFCFACIETYPPQSEILLTADSIGVSVNRTIDILTPSKEKLSFVGIHK